MALQDNAVLIPGKGTVFHAPIGTTVPDYKLLDPADETTFAGWECLGHTSRENTIELAKEGGEAEQKGSWWNSALRSVYTDITWNLTVSALQVDKDTFDLAYGGFVDQTSGGYVVPDTLIPAERALLVLMVDGSGRMALHFPKTTTTIGEAPTIDPENFFETKLTATALAKDGRRFAILHPNFDLPSAG